MNKFKKGDRVTFQFTVSVTVDEQDAVVLGPAKRVKNHYRVRLRPPLLIRDHEGKVLDGKWEETVHERNLTFDVIKTLKRAMRGKDDKKSAKVPIKTATAKKRKRKGRGKLKKPNK